ncbi:glycerophosphoryl diester phosphodiesterase membrane domain-containing protein [Cellulomonas timonensis]|uniref:glycerophosphoryl diester phosphodiesterase membrane domain-containing protein n=1 Tax=Cellulomonas timonensis TaxID=1689271 RepID=UPI00082F1D8B|nr:glycerophosphoryl diester phosphodiesterase membrane domain-containing protein [Cellulomonas timonensis]
MFGLAVMVVTVVVIVQAALEWYVGGLISGALADFSATADPTGDLGLDQQLGMTLGSLLSLPLLLVATTVLTGLLIVSVSRSVIGQTVTLGEAVRVSKRRVWWVLGITLLYLAVIAVGYAVVAGGIVLAASDERWALVGIAAIFGSLLMLAATVWISVRMLLVAPALMLEGGAFWATVRRGWKLTRGSFWRLFGIYLLVQIIMSVVVGIIAVPTAVISGVFFNDPLMLSFGGIAVSSIANVISYTLTTVFSAAVVALLYIDIRMRREGLDVELARAADQTAA